MVKIKEVDEGSIASSLGIVAGDMLCSVNGHSIQDDIDLAFWEAEEDVVVEIRRNGTRARKSGKKLAEEKLGIHLHDFEFKRCNNRCIFCFYDQMPPGLRESLYEKDDDFRFSFLYGNYITLTNMSEGEFARIEEQRLSPLYISVHATDPAVRRKLLGGEGGEIAIDPLLHRLADSRIEMHTQIVICPGINDGKVLEETVHDLAALHPHVRSVAVIPVGLSKYRQGLYPLRRVDREHCLELIQKILLWQEEFRGRFGIGFVYPADELLIKGEFAIPMKEFYDGFPQLENGIGNSRIFLDAIDRMEMRSLEQKRATVVFVTGMLARPWLELLKKRFQRETMHSCEVHAIPNSFFGETVTVTGLLTGQDVLRALASYERYADLFLIPSNCLNASNAFIDDITLEEIRDRTGKRIVAAPPHPDDLPGLLLEEYV